MKGSFSVGVDEAGRGPLAGPVSIGVVLINNRFKKSFFRGIKDSKKLTEKMREEWFEKAKEAKLGSDLNYAVALVSEKVIDKKGIVFAINSGMEKCFKTLNIPRNSKIYLDGSLHAPKTFKNQKTIIKGDEKIALISLASIMAKVTRDRHMIRQSKKFPQYGLEINKGYGTSSHLKKIKELGPSEIHRKSYLTKLI